MHRFEEETVVPALGAPPGAAGPEYLQHRRPILLCHPRQHGRLLPNRPAKCHRSTNVGIHSPHTQPNPSTRPRPSARMARVAPMLGLGAIVLAAVAFSPSTPFPGLAALLPCLGAALVIWPGGNTAPAILRSKPMVLLGLISYPLYLWHWPVLVFARYALLRDPTPIEMASLVLLSVALAWATWRL